MRKTVLLMAALAVGLGALWAQGMVSGRHVRAAEGGSRMPQAARDTSGFTALSTETRTLEVGDVRVTWIQDRAAMQPVNLFPQAPASLIDSLHLRGGIPSSLSTFLVESKGMRILFDTGLGGKDSRLLHLLSLMGLTPADIGFIYLTHLHSDHIGGLLDGGRPMFPMAQVFVSKQEFKGWMGMPGEKKAQVERMAKAYRLNLHFFDFGDYLPGGVKTIDASGHTPGHTVFRVGGLLIVGDILHGAALQLADLDLCPTYDMNPAEARAARKRMLQLARTDSLVMAGMHLPAPGFMKF